MVKNGAAGSESAIHRQQNGLANGKQQQPSGEQGKRENGVGKILTNFISNASAACYIGQNGLYQSNGKAKENGSCNNKSISSFDKKEL